MKPVIQPDIRYRGLWLLIGIAMVITISLACLLPGKDLPEVHIWDKAEHMIAFGSLAFWFGSIVIRRDLPWVAIGVIAFGGLIEVLQGTMGLGRDADWHDLLADSVGVALGLALVVTPLGRWVHWFEALLAPARP